MKAGLELAYCFLRKYMNLPVSKGSKIMVFWVSYLRSTL
jgi:hypothetical protein